ncbi:hypothetical protein RJ55_04465 [Drechmeria coniospora]|nr:hypothetical protein RJ55_04465 [Drechmeria coniospora]
MELVERGGNEMPGKYKGNDRCAGSGASMQDIEQSLVNIAGYNSGGVNAPCPQGGKMPTRTRAEIKTGMTPAVGTVTRITGWQAMVGQACFPQL